MTIFEYAKLNNVEKESILKNEALYIEHYIENDNVIYVYFLNDFFVEVTIKEGIVIDNLPFKRGYKINKKEIHQTQKKNIFTNLSIQLNSYIEKSHLVSVGLTTSLKTRMIRMLLLEN